MTTQATTQIIDVRSKRSTGLLVIAALGAVLTALAVAVGVGPAEAREGAAAGTGKVVFVSNRTLGPGVVNPQGDPEIFVMDPNGTNLKQLTKNAVDDSSPALSQNGQKVAYRSDGMQASNPEGDPEVYIVNADGSGQKNLTNSSAGVNDYSPTLSANGQKIAYESGGVQTSNPEGEYEVYTVNANGTGKKNLTNNAAGVHDYAPVFSPDGQRIAFHSNGAQTSNPEGDFDVYTMNANGSSPSNFTFISGGGVDDYFSVFSPDGQKIAFQSKGVQTSNPEGDTEVYVRNTSGLNEINLSNNAVGVYDYVPVFSPDGQKTAFMSSGVQTSNPEGDRDVYTVNANGSGKRNLTNNGADVDDDSPDYAPDGTKLVYRSSGKQTSNPTGDEDLYRMNNTGTGQTNLTKNGVTDFYPRWGS